MMKELIKQEIDNVLLKVRDGVLALTDGKLPYGIPFGFVYVNESVYLSMLPKGRKWSYLQKPPWFVLMSFTGMKIIQNSSQLSLKVNLSR